MRLLVTGASGFLGWEVLRQAHIAGHETMGQYRHTPVANGYKADMTQEGQVREMLQASKPNVVVHCAAMSKPDDCARDVQGSRKTNIEATSMLAALCADMGIKLVFTSTDLVFDGARGNYAEDDNLNPIMHYGEHKAEAEARVLAFCPGSAVCRMPLMYGHPSPGGQSFLQGFIGQLRQGKTLSLFYDEWRSVLYAPDAAQGLLWAAAHVRGIVHLGGPQSLDRFAFGQLLVQAFGFDSALIKPCQQQSMVFSAPRPSNCSLNSMFAYSLGFKPLMANLALRHLALSNPMEVIS